MAEDGITDRYARRFAGLRRDVSRARWSEVTLNGAPHKPLLLLSVLDVFEQGPVTANLIELTPDLGELFTCYWTRIMPTGAVTLPYLSFTSVATASGTSCRSRESKVFRKTPPRSDPSPDCKMR